MKCVCIPAIVCAVLVLAAPAPAEDKATGLTATITDTYDFKMKLDALAFNLKLRSGLAGKAVSLDHIPLMAGDKRVNLWLAQIATATFKPKAGGQTEVSALLQGEDDVVAGVLHNTSRCSFEGKIAEGDRKGRAVRLPLAEVKALDIHTKYTGGARLGKGQIIPMPAPDQDVLWISSVPLGAQVFAKPFDCEAALAWKDYVQIGRTPLMRELGPGKYAIKVHVPDKLATKLRPATKLGEDAIPFERGTWGEVTFRKGENVIASVTYTLEKREGKAATLIALFQRKGLTLDEVVESCPEGYSFNFDDKKLTEALLYQEVPRADIPKVLDALHRGGKMIWHGEKKSLMIELTPGPRGWRIGGAERPKKSTGGE
ncbi:MAG: hypothetical protein ABIF82_00280 [Planctomycetota bacterium]